MAIESHLTTFRKVALVKQSHQRTGVVEGNGHTFVVLHAVSDHGNREELAVLGRYDFGVGDTTSHQEGVELGVVGLLL